MAISPRSLAVTMALRSVLLAYDGSPEATAALDIVAEITGRTEVSVTIVFVLDTARLAYGLLLPAGASVDQTVEAAEGELVRAKALLEGRGVRHVETQLLKGRPVERILAYAEEHPPDLIVAGGRALSEAGRLFLGSVSDGILHHARGSVLIVRGPGRPSPTPNRSVPGD